ncbi:hypothetical protein cypCar_00012401 [Cyprinus carpio]|nr:hypothetical protein cypCar_00012401 [Cyprinus carpio]
MQRSLLLLFIVFSMGNAEVNLVKKCPYGWTNLGVRCYKFFSQMVTWITAEEAQWLWTDGTPFDYTHWAPGQPDNKGEPRTESCGELNYENNGWNDGTCLTPQGYVCAKYL